MILRMPERFLPPFLKQMKQDFINKKKYLKYLRINSKFIRCCHCHYKICHAYCTTAFVLRNQKIYCKDCDGYFQLQIRLERIFNTEYLGGIIKVGLVGIFFSLLIWGVYNIDLYLKNKQYIMDKINSMEALERPK